MSVVEASWPAALSVVAGLCSLPLTGWIWGYRDRPGAVYWAGVQAVITLWALAYGLSLATFDPALHRLFNPLLWLARVAGVPLILLFALEYTGRDHLTTPRVAAGLFGFWALALAFYVTNGVHGLAWSGYRVEPVFGAAATAFTPEVGALAIAGAAYVSNAVAVLLVLEPLVSYRRLFGRQAVVIIFAVAAPTAVNVVWLFRLPPTAHLDLTPVVFLGTTAAVSYALFREELFEFLPAATRIADDIAIDDIDAAVLTVAPNGRLIDLNRPATELFDLERAGAAGRPLGETLAVDVPLEPTAVTLSDPLGRNRVFDVSVSPITSRSDDLVGYVVTFYDITDERRRQQRLAVQNRILRHNLRNSLTVIEGGLDRIEDVAADGDVGPAVGRVRDAAGDLLAVSTKVRRFDEGVSAEPRRVDVAELCRSTAASVAADHPDAVVDVDADGPATVEVRDRLLGQILAEVIENALVHADGPAPHVSVAVTGTTDGVEVTVADDGPGIPAAELEALHDADEDPLRHGSGIGLWVIRWGVGVLGGTVSFDATEDDGTVVSISVPG